MRIVDIGRTDQLLDSVHTEILAPSFPPAELISAGSLRTGVASGEIAVTAAVDGAGRLLAAACGEWSPASGILLLAYLAARPGQRGGGLGSKLLEYAVQEWVPRYGAGALLAEIEHPAAHQGSPDHGDPAARLRFYARHRCQALDLPYFQPALRPGLPRVYGLLLAAVAVSSEMAGPWPGTMAAAPVRRYLAEYFADTEGGIGTDSASTALFSALDDARGVRLLSLDRPDRIPLSTPDGSAPKRP